MPHTNRVVIVHRCCNPNGCDCKFRVSIKEANEMIRQAEADWVMRLNSLGFLVRDDRAVMVQNRKPSPIQPRPQMISERHIEKAYIDGNRCHRDRIEEFKPKPLIGIEVKGLPPEEFCGFA